MRPPRKFGPRARTAKQRRDALANLLRDCRVEMLPTFTAEGLSQTTGVAEAECKAALDEARRVRL